MLGRNYCNNKKQQLLSITSVKVILVYHFNGKTCNIKHTPQCIQIFKHSNYIHQQEIMN